MQRRTLTYVSLILMVSLFVACSQVPNPDNSRNTTDASLNQIVSENVQYQDIKATLAASGVELLEANAITTDPVDGVSGTVVSSIDGSIQIHASFDSEGLVNLQLVKIEGQTVHVADLTTRELVKSA